MNYFLYLYSVRYALGKSNIISDVIISELKNEWNNIPNGIRAAIHDSINISKENNEILFCSEWEEILKLKIPYKSGFVNLETKTNGTYKKLKLSLKDGSNDTKFYVSGDLEWDYKELISYCWLNNISLLFSSDFDDYLYHCKKYKWCEQTDRVIRVKKENNNEK